MLFLLWHNDPIINIATWIKWQHSFTNIIYIILKQNCLQEWCEIHAIREPHTHTSTMLVVKFTNSNRTSNLIGQIRTYAKNSDTFQRTCQYIIWQIIKPIVPFIVCIRIFTQLSNSAAYNIERFAYLADKRVALVIHIIRWTRDHLNTCSVWWWSLLLIRAGRPQCV